MRVISWIVDTISVMYVMSKQEYGGTLMMTKSLKSVIFQKVYIIERITNKKVQRKQLYQAQTN